MKNKILYILCIFFVFVISMQGQVLKNINVATPGTLGTLIGNDKTTITDLTLTGTINDADFETIKQMSSLNNLDLGKSQINNGEIPANAFKGKKLNTIILPSNLEVVGQSAFRESKLNTELVLPTSLKSLRYESFCYASIPSIDFSQCSQLERIGGDAFWDLILQGDKTIDFTKSVKLKNFDAGAYQRFSGHVILPSNLEVIPNQTFNGFLGSVDLPEGLKTITYQAFLHANFTKELIFPNSLERIERFAFGGAVASKGMRFGTGLKVLERRCFDHMTVAFMDFSNCYNLEELGASVFSGINPTENKTLDFSNSNKLSRFIPYGSEAAFSGFQGHIVLSDDLNYIASNTFGYFEGTVSLPKKLKTIEQGAFANASIVSINFPSSLIQIQDYAFFNCTKLQTITSNSLNPSSLGSTVFSGVNKGTCKLLVPEQSESLYKNTDQWKDFQNVATIKESEKTEIPDGSDDYAKGKEGSIHIWISQYGTQADVGRSFVAYDFDKKAIIPKGTGFQGTYKTIEIGEYEYTTQNLQAKYQILDGVDYARLNWTDANIAGITKTYSNETPLSIEKFGEFYGNWFNFYPNALSYGLEGSVKFRDKEGGTEISGWGLPNVEDMAQLIGQAPRLSSDYRADVLDFVGASKQDAPEGHHADWFDRNHNTSGLTLTPLGSREPVEGAMDYKSYNFKTLSRLRLKERGQIFNFTRNNDSGFNGSLYQYMQVRYNRSKSDEELGYKMYIDNCNDAVVILPYNKRTKLTELPKGLERGIALRYTNRSEQKVYRRWSDICYEADQIRKNILNLPARPNLPISPCIDPNAPDEFEKGKEGSVHIWISNSQNNNQDAGGLCFAPYNFDKNISMPENSGFQGTYKTIEIGEYEYTSQNLRAKYQNHGGDNSYDRLNWTDANIAGITKTYSNETPLSVEDFGKFYGNWFNFYHNVGTYGFDELIKFRDKEGGTEISGWSLPDAKDIAQLVGLTPRVSSDFKADVLRFVGASNADAPVGHEADWFNKAKNISGLTLTPLGSRDPGSGSMDEYVVDFKKLSRLRLKGRGKIFSFTLDNDFGYNGNLYLYMQVRYTRPKTDEELGYKMFVDLEKDSVMITSLSQVCSENFREIAKSLERGIALRYTNFDSNKVFKSWSEIKEEATYIRSTMRDLPIDDPLLSCTPNVVVTRVTLNRTQLNLSIGENKTLVATVLPEEATNREVTWSSSDETIATVSSEGVITAITEGTATITVTTIDGNKTATCRITVDKEGDNPIDPDFPDVPNLPEDNKYTEITDSDYKLVFKYNLSGDRIERNVIVLKQRSTENIEPEDIFTDQISDHRVKIYPNPTKGQLMVEISDLSDISSGNIKILNLQGRIVSNRPISNNRINLDISSQPTGIYIMHIIIDGKSTSWKVIKE